jgi:hypothetical protein
MLPLLFGVLFWSRAFVLLCGDIGERYNPVVLRGSVHLIATIIL